MLGIMASIDQKDSYAATPSTGWLPWSDAPCAVFPRAVVRVGMPKTVVYPQLLFIMVGVQFLDKVVDVAVHVGLL